MLFSFLAALVQSARSPPASLLGSLVFFKNGTLTPALSQSIARLTQCNGFSECYTAWTCGSPRDYAWDTSVGRNMTSVRAPPLGIRSAVPLGGIGAGTFELRADGTFADWMIEGQGTALAANSVQNSKIPLKDEAFLAMYSSSGGAVPLRTAPPSAGMPPIAGLTYSGAFPFSRLAIEDARFPFSASLFAYSGYQPHLPAAQSGRPFAAFSLVLSAPASAPGPVNASLLLSLPLGTSLDTDRPLQTDPRGQLLATLQNTTAAQCLAACDALPACVWWRRVNKGTPAPPSGTFPNMDCPGNDLYNPPRTAFANISACIAHCSTSVPGCGGLVFDTIPGEQQGQCGNTNPGLFCCLPKSQCTGFVPKVGDTAWAAPGPPPILPGTCTLYALAPPVETFTPGTGDRSGVKGRWAPLPSGSGLRHTRTMNGYDGDPRAAFADPASATLDYVLLAVDEGGGQCGPLSPTCSVSWAVEEDVDAVFSNFAAGGGRLSAPTAPPPLAGGHGALAVSLAALAPGETRTLTLLFAWHTPYHMYVGQELGNFVASQYADAAAVAGEAAGELFTTVLPSGVAWNALWGGATALPEWMRDFMANSVSYQSKMTVWVQRGADLQPLAGGRFRQFEAYSGCDLGPVHVLDYSMIPLILSFPELLMNEIATGWAARQQQGGMVEEFLGDFSAPGGRVTGPMDISSGGRVMGDVTTVFILATLGCFQSTNDTAFVRGIWGNLTSAARWQMSTAKQFGCPAHLQTTYDYLGLDAYTVNPYNSMLHLAAMRATVKLAAIVGDTSSLAADAQASEAACLSSLSSLLWVEPSAALGKAAASGGFWRAFSHPQGEQDIILSGALHGQSWATFLGLGLLAPLANISSHTAAETQLNCAYSADGSCPFGLQTLPGKGGMWTLDASPSMNMDATVARLLSGLGGLQGSHAESMVTLYRDVHADLWDWKDLHMGVNGYGCGADLSGVGLAGQPFVNAHYARHVQGWAAYLALSGQRFEPGGGGLSFAPLCEGWVPVGAVQAGAAAAAAAELTFPFLTPSAHGHLTVHWPARNAYVRLLSGGGAGAAAAVGGTRRTVHVDFSRCKGPLGEAPVASTYEASLD